MIINEEHVRKLWNLRYNDLPLLCIYLFYGLRSKDEDAIIPMSLCLDRQSKVMFSYYLKFVLEFDFLVFGDWSLSTANDSQWFIADNQEAGLVSYLHGHISD